MDPEHGWRVTEREAAERQDERRMALFDEAFQRRVGPPIAPFRPFVEPETRKIDIRELLDIRIAEMAADGGDDIAGGARQQAVRPLRQADAASELAYVVQQMNQRLAVDGRRPVFGTLLRRRSGRIDVFRPAGDMRRDYGDGQRGDSRLLRNKLAEKLGR
ncbi:MAG: hypothetical protein NTY77_00725 [Elusimicrobia bacterium]|nr:hypothetical protein [Elusimicrobiota bacterium]